MHIEEELQKKLVVYTVIMGDYDYLREPDFVMENCDYICFTNNKEIKSDVWKIIYDSEANLDNTRWQRRHKVMAHEYLKDYDWSVYVDGNVKILGDFREYIRQESKGSTVLCLKHPNRDNIYDEAEECKKLNKDSVEIIDEQMNRYKEEGYDAQNGLVVSNVLVRKHSDPEVIALMECWWDEICKGSRRDQLSFNYACWKKNFTYDESQLKPWKSDYWRNPGIHTKNIEAVEEELVKHLQLEDYYEGYIRLKEQELKDAKTYISWKEQELKDAHTYIEWKEQELKDAKTYIGWKEQELKDAKTYTGWKEQELKDAHTYTGWKEQELKEAKKNIRIKEHELEEARQSIVKRSIKKLLRK